MSNFKDIRKRLGVTQAELAPHLECTQGNVSHYEKGMTVPVDTAKRLIQFAKTKHIDLTLEDIYAEQEQS